MATSKRSKKVAPKRAASKDTTTRGSAPAGEEQARRVLYSAIASGDVASLRAVADSHPALLDEGYNTETWLHFAAGKGHLAICEELVRRGADVDAPDDNPSGLAKGFVAPRRLGPLSKAVREGRDEIVYWLLDRGAKVDGPSTATGTPLMTAVALGHINFTRALVERGADLARESMMRPWTALDWAYPARGGAPEGGQRACADFLESRGAIRPFAAPHEWGSSIAPAQLAHIEAHLGIVHPAAHRAAKGQGDFEIHRTRFAPERWAHQLVFTAGLGQSSGAEFGIVLPAEWPTHAEVRQEARFVWPFTLLERVARAVESGAKIGIGQLFDRAEQWSADTPFAAWAIARSDDLEVNRKRYRGTYPTLLMTPVRLGRAQPSKEKSKRLIANASAEWEMLTLPVPDLTPTGWGSGPERATKF